MKQNRTYKNRLLSLLLAAAIGIGGTVCYAANTVQLPFCSPYTAQAEEQTAGEFSYSVQNDTITITKYNGSAASGRTGWKAGYRIGSVLFCGQ